MNIFKSDLPHYVVQNGKCKYFLSWEEAFVYCEINNLNIDCIYKTYTIFYEQ